MRKLIKSPVNLLIICVLASMIMLTGCSKDPLTNSENNPFLDESTTKVGLSLTDAEIASLNYMVEEEKLALDVYTYWYEMYGLKIFDRISQSEVKHVSAVSKLFVKYSLDNPIDGNPAGYFENEDLQLLYNDLIEMGMQSKFYALNTGVIIENTDIIDIQTYLDEVVESKDLEQVYLNLLSGSYKHLAAFNEELAPKF